MKFYLLIFCLIVLSACKTKTEEKDTNEIVAIQMEEAHISISRDQYYDQLYGFWLGQCIANWTGLVTEMDKIGNIGEIRTGPFYTRHDWGKT